MFKPVVSLYLGGSFSKTKEGYLRGPTLPSASIKDVKRPGKKNKTQQRSINAILIEGNDFPN